MNLREKIQAFIVTQNPSIAEMLPYGCINILAINHRLSRQAISDILKGKSGNMKNVLPVVKEAISLIENDIEQKNAFLSTLPNELKKEAVQVAA